MSKRIIMLTESTLPNGERCWMAGSDGEANNLIHWLTSNGVSCKLMSIEEVNRLSIENKGNENG